MPVVVCYSNWLFKTHPILRETIGEFDEMRKICILQGNITSCCRLQLLLAIVVLAPNFVIAATVVYAVV